MRPFIKICCIESVEEANLAIQSGAGALGLVSSMPSGPGSIDERLIAEIAATVPSHIDTFLLTSRAQADEIAEQHARCKTTTVQLVDEVAPVQLAQLRLVLPKVKLVKVVHVVNAQAIALAQSMEPWVDALLLDSGNPTLAPRTLGGTGRIHDWAISREICAVATKPVFLAGGLSAANVAAALASVGSYGVDVCSGVRSNGRLDARKLQEFIHAIA